MANAWFRFYNEVLNDPKVQSLSGDDFKAWVNLLCVGSLSEGKLPDTSHIAFALRVQNNDAITLIERLLNAGLIDRVNGGANGWHYVLHSWDKRQFKSDSSADRVRRYREKQRNVTETPPDTDTDTEKNKKSSKDDSKAPPKKGKDNGKMPYTGELPPPDWGNWAMTELKMKRSDVVEQWILFRDYWTIGKGKTTRRSPEGWDTSWKKWCRKDFGDNTPPPAQPTQARAGALQA